MSEAREILLSDTRYIRIEGTQVVLLARDEGEARIALKELQHKKKELLHFKRRLTRQRKAFERLQEQDRRVGMTPLLSPLSFFARSFGAVVALVTGWNPFPAGGMPATLEACREDLNALEEILLNVNEAILHVQGKLIERSG